MEHEGLLLCSVGKKKVRNAIQKVNDANYRIPKDATDFLATLKSEPGMYCDYTLDAQGRLVDVFWSTVEQKQKCSRYGACIQLDTTVFTNRYACPLLLVVGVDGENRSCILGQGIMRSECTQTFKWFLDNYVAAAGGRKPKVILTDADLAMTAAIAACWGSTLHLFCLWHVMKNIVKNCSSSFGLVDDKSDVMRLFRSAAYAATPEVFHTYRAQVEQLVAGTKCERYMAGLIRNKTKWAFSCRPTVLTLGMVATQRVEGIFGVAEKMVLNKNMSLCALWKGLQRLILSLDIEAARLATPAISASVDFSDKHMNAFFQPIKQELQAVGASQYCQNELRAQVEQCRSYDVELVTRGTFDDTGHPLPLSSASLATIRSARPKLNILHAPPPDTDLEGDSCRCKEETPDASMWAHTSMSAFLGLIASVPVELVVAVQYKLSPKKPSHLVVFGPDSFHLCSCLQLLRRGLPCRHYFAVLVALICSTDSPTELAFDHRFNGVSVHNRWRRLNNDLDLAWSVSEMLTCSGHGSGWDGHKEGDDDNYWGPTLDDNSDGVHPAERAVQAGQDRKVSDQRRVFANMMAKSKENVSEILRSVSPDQALDAQRQVDVYVRFLLQNLSEQGHGDEKNPARPPQKGRPRKKDSRGRLIGGGSDGRPKASCIRPAAGASGGQAGNPAGRAGGTRRTKRFRDSVGLGSGKKSKRSSGFNDSVD